MDHSDHVDLLQAGVKGQSGQWADLGCGDGAFTLALAELLEAQALIHAVDLDRRALTNLERRARSGWPEIEIRTLAADFSEPLDLSSLDGIVMANSLHFYAEKEPIVRSARAMLRPGGRFILVEYNVDRGNRWVPYPISFHKWRALARECGFLEIKKIGTKPSTFLGEVYSAASQ